MSLRGPAQSLALLVATGFGTGRAPIAPGTAGTLLAVPLVFLAGRLLPPYGFALAGLLLAALGVWSAGVAAPLLGAKDPGPVVIDEVAGLFFTLMFLPAGGRLLVAGFVIFRLMDIVKPFPARQAESLPAGWGIVADDVIAGLYANLALRAGLALLHRIGS